MGELYAFRTACEAMPNQAEQAGVTLDHLRQVQFRRIPEGLQARHASLNPAVSVIEAALGGTAPIVTPAQEALDRLRAMGGTEG
jgi:hypothetical protein